MQQKKNSMLIKQVNIT